MTATAQFETAAFQYGIQNFPPSYEIVPTLTNGNQFVPVARKDSQWVQELESRFKELTGLPIGWDGYQGKPVSSSCAKFAANLIESICVDHVPAPQLVPGSDGTLQLEWHLNGYDIEIDVLAPLEVVATRHDHVTGEEDEIKVESDFSELAEWVTALGEARAAVQVVENRAL